MKTIKFLATRLLIVSLAFSIYSCENEDKRDPDPTPAPGGNSIVGKWEAKKVKNITTGGDWYTPSTYQLLDIKADGTFGTENQHHGVYTYIGNKLTLSYLTANVSVHAIVLSLTQTELHWRSDVEMQPESNVLEYIWERVGSGGGGTDPNSSEVTFWVNWDDGGGTIYVNINGTTKDITSYYPGQTTIDGCNKNGCANFTLSPGTYSYTASDANESWQGTITLSAGQCHLIHLNHGSGGGGGGSNSGKATFWTKSDLGCGNITVNINGTTRTINSYYSNGIGNGCDVSGCANFTLSPGSYSYSASSSGGMTWNGTVNISANGCNQIQLTGNCNGGGGGGGGGGGSNSGKVTFYTKSNLGCGSITVTINGTTRTISSYYSNGIGNGCDVSGCANFTLSPGTYSFSAKCSAYTWNGTVNISANGCLQYHLY